ncbi:hypothetical protein S40288_07050 [Stachybotrys chartarum IBT 40288]|nr:hypothetical protein S40288_07050 [Stachybotrys chartarum IBT 40288]
MADSRLPPNSAQHHPPPQVYTGVPGFDNPRKGKHTPQDTSPIPTAITAPLAGVGKGGILSHTAPGGFRRAAPEPNKRALYVGGLDPWVTEDVLRQTFEITDRVQNVRIIPVKNANGFKYGFVEYDDPGAAERAMQTLNGGRVYQWKIRVNWAYPPNATSKEDTSSHFHIFVGDLSDEVNDEVLTQVFSAFGSVSEARVMWDMKTGRSRGYGFVAFRDRPDAEKALSSMHGEWLGSRAIRCNWAIQKGQPSIAQQQAMQAMGLTPTTPYCHHQFPTHGVASYEVILAQTPNWQTTCYVGNLTPYTTPDDLVPLFQSFGFVGESRLQADRGFAFIKMDTHENAAMAICQMNGYNVNGRPLRCSWGKDQTLSGSLDPAQPYSPQNPQTAGGFLGTLTYYPQYGAGQFGGQPSNFGGPRSAFPAGYAGSPMSFNGPQSAGIYGQPPSWQWTQPRNGQWAQPPPGQSFYNGSGGYQS